MSTLPGRVLVPALLSLLCLLALLAGCTGGGAPAPGAATSSAGAPTGPAGSVGSSDAADRGLTVLAAASLTEVFTALGEDFAARNPGVDVRFAFDSSATLADQAAQGAPADVLATADATTMQRAVDAGVTAADPSTFARNRLVLVTPAGASDEPAVTGVDDLAGDGTVLVVCVPTAPCGALAAQLLERLDRDITPASLATDVKAVLAQVVADEADAGLVYATDAVAAGADVREVELPGPALRTDYLLAPLSQARDPDLAAAWIRYLDSPAARTVLTDAGFDEADEADGPPASGSPANP